MIDKMTKIRHLDERQDDLSRWSELCFLPKTNNGLEFACSEFMMSQSSCVRCDGRMWNPFPLQHGSKHNIHWYGLGLPFDFGPVIWRYVSIFFFSLSFGVYPVPVCVRSFHVQTGYISLHTSLHITLQTCSTSFTSTHVSNIPSPFAIIMP